MTSNLKRLLGTTIAASALTVGSLCVFAVPAFAGTENTTCVDINFSGNTSNGNASVTVLGQKCSSPVQVRSYTSCVNSLTGVVKTDFGPTVITGVSRAAGCVGQQTPTGVEDFLGFGWDYFKNGAWHIGSAGANT
jgi:hypothetical protein